MPRLCCEAGVQQQGPGAGRLLGMQRDGAGRTAARVTLPNLNPTLARARSRSTSRWRSRHCSSWARCSWATSRWCTWTTGASRRPFLKALLQACFTPPLKTSRCRFGGMRAQVWVGCKVP